MNGLVLVQETREGVGNFRENRGLERRGGEFMRVEFRDVSYRR